jgi:hypothetical protein
MAAPTVYTEKTLADFMQATLADLATTLGWTTTPDDYQEAVNEALLTYGTSAISTITGTTNIRKLRAIARVQVWRQVVAAVAGDYDFEADGAKFDRSQVQEMARQALALAEVDAMAYGALDGYEVGVDTVVNIHDPYRYVEDDDRVRD